MFDKNKNIKVGRDININITNDLEQLNRAGLLKKKKECSIIYKKATKLKWKKVYWSFFITLILLVLTYFSFPILYGYLIEKSDDSLLKGAFPPLSQNVQFIISILVSAMPTFLSINELFNDNDTQKRQREMEKKIDILLKEKEYLNKE